MRKLYILILLIPVAYALTAVDKINFNFSAETGFLSVIDHKIQSGTSGDKGDVFDYRTQGNQDILFLYYRFQGDISYDKHHVILLYQPLTIATTADIDEDFRYNQVDFTTSDGFMNLVYGFDFWRFSYLYDFVVPSGYFFSAGLSLQIRNASIVFQSSENGKSIITDNVGPVPIVKLKAGYQWKAGPYILFEGDGFYASNAIFNGAEYPFMGYIYDLSLRAGFPLDGNLSAYVNGRFLGGGAEGTNDEGQYTYNSLHTFAFTLGGIWEL